MNLKGLTFPKSAEGVLLGNILQKQHLFKYAVSKQLDELASEKNRLAASKEESLDSILHRRIVEMKEKQRQVAVEDIMYMCIVHKFSQVGVPMVQKLSKRISKNNLEILPLKCTDLDSIHSPDIQDMIRMHLHTVVCMTARPNAVDMSRTSKVDRLHLGRIYAKSILYGYFLKAACLRRQFDSNLAHSKENSQHLGQGTYSSVPELQTSGFEGIATVGQSTDAQAQLTSSCDDTRNECLASYVMGFDAESLQRCAKLKSKEVVNVIEKHTWALFGDDRIAQLDAGNDVVITFPSLERLVTEAVSFGIFLWDVERSRDSVYGLNEN